MPKPTYTLIVDKKDWPMKIGVDFIRIIRTMKPGNTYVWMNKKLYLYLG